MDPSILSGSATNSSGWNIEKIFLEYLDCFIQYLKPSREKLIIIILDNHDPHTTENVIKMFAKITFDNSNMLLVSTLRTT